MSKTHSYRRNISKYGRRWLLLMIGPVLLVVAGLVILVLYRQGQLDRMPWSVVGMATGAIGALSASLLTLFEAFKEPAPVDGRHPDQEEPS